MASIVKNLRLLADETCLRLLLLLTAQQAQHTVANRLGGLLSISSRDGVPKLADRELGRLWASSLN